MKKAVSVCLIEKGKVLIAARGTGAGQGLYSFPGGRVEEGETLTQALAREIREEIGISCRIIKPFHEMKLFETFHLSVFLGDNPSATPLPTHEAINPHFITLEELKNYKTTPYLYEIAAKGLREYLKIDC